MIRRGRGPLRRLSWGLLDQVFSSGTNFAVNILLARSISLGDFGAYSLAFFLYVTVISVCRAFPMEPLAIRYSTVEPAVWREGVAMAVGTSLAVGVIAGFAGVVAGLIAGGVLGGALIVFGVLLPGLVLQDSWRYAFFAGGRGRDALLNDIVWAVLLLPILALLAVTGRLDVFTGSLVFGLTACAAALFGLLQSRTWPRPRLATDWWTEQRDLAGKFLVEAVVRNGAAQLTLYGIGVVAGLAAVGEIRAGQLLLAPVQVVFFGVALIAVPEAVRALERSRHALLHLSLGASSVLLVLALTWGAAMLLLPESVGELLLRGNWAPARAILPPLVVGLGATVTIIGASMGLRALAAAGHSLRAGIVGSTAGVVLPVGFAALGGAPGAAVGMAFGGLVAVAAWWFEYGRALRAVLGFAWRRAQS